MLRKFASTSLAAMMALAGCSGTQSQLKQKAGQVVPAVFNTNSNRPGRVLEPKYCKLDTAIISRPSGDKVVEASIWNVADEQVIPVDLRQNLQANGLRVGIITGALPADVLGAFNPTPPTPPTQWVHVAQPEGEHTPIVVGGQVESVTLLLNHGGKVDGRDYHDAGGRLNVTTGHDGPYDVSLRVVPEVHHGDTRRTIAPLQATGPFAQQEFSIKDGQQEDILRELTTKVTVKPGQTLAIGCIPAQARSIGTFLFTQPEQGTDRMLQSVLLIQANRNNAGIPPLKPVEEMGDGPGPDLAVRPISAGLNPFGAKDASRTIR